MECGFVVNNTVSILRFLVAGSLCPNAEPKLGSFIPKSQNHSRGFIGFVWLLPYIPIEQNPIGMLPNLWGWIRYPMINMSSPLSG